MSKYKLSPWHDGSVRPVHQGVYERFILDGKTSYSYWDGHQWLFSKPEIYGAFIESCHRITDRSSYQNRKWRGILKD